ncbi:MAG: hypothetical protein QOJ32_3170 [Frankiaceae bacterium]|nr:hypothetical protein [Frankiaceae bacterium]
MTADVSTPPAVTTAPPRPGRTRRLLPAVTVAVCAALLFLVEPLTAKSLLPLFGGTAAVWTGSVLFFQVVLLVGYALVHRLLAPDRQRDGGSSRRSPLRLAATVVLLVLPVVVLPLHVPEWAAPGEHAPLPWLLLVLAVMVGLPFLALSVAGPLVSSWLVGETRRSPYQLYAASNAGSIGGLLAYPLLAEPLADAEALRTIWSIGYVVAAILLVACAATVARRPIAPSPDPEPDSPAPAEAAPSSRRRERLTWLALAALPVSLMLGTTTVLTTDVAPVPLLWVVPLALYLLTLAIAFAPVTEATRPKARATPPVLLAVVGLAAVGSTTALQLPKLLQIAVDLSVLTLVALVAHRRLADSRPPTARLTEFYLIVALGGALGGAFNSLVAPLIFVRISEFPLALLAAIALLVLGIAGVAAPQVGRQVKQPQSQLRLAATELGALATPLLFLLLARVTGPGALVNVLLAGGLLAAGWWLAGRRPMPLALGVSGILLLTLFPLPPPLQAGRNFYGTYAVAEADGRRLLTEGTTVHGWQYLDASRRREPTAYYSTAGPIGQVFSRYADDPALRQVDVVGLGAGTLAAYGQPSQTMRFYELDPQIAAVARDPRLFSYLADSRASVSETTGDGRLLLERRPDASAGLLVLDAFSSDAIPTHLLTAQAFGVYNRVLQPGGLLAVHITNRFLDLRPVLAGAAAQAGMSAVIRDDDAPAVAGQPRIPSRWVVLARNPARLDLLRRTPGWVPLPSTPSVRWTDDYSSLLALLRRPGTS